jgi:hypothetical protein
MDAEREPPRWNKPRCKVLVDHQGSHHYVVEREKVPNSPHSRSQIDVWWNRAQRRPMIVTNFGKVSNIEETLILRQENTDGRPADVIICSHGQAYDLIDAITRAVEQP